MNHQPSPEALAPDPPASAKRTAILEAAAALFRAQGYGVVSMDAVARRAGVSKATLYAHFGAKDRLFAAIISNSCALMRSTAPGAESLNAGPGREALMAMGRHWLQFLLKPESLATYRMVVAEGTRFPELAEGFYANGPQVTRAWLAEWIAAQAEAGRLQVSDPARAAEHFLALLRGDLFLRATLALPPAPDAAAIEATVAAAVDSFCRAYGAG